MKNWFLVFTGLFLLAGCADSSTVGTASEREYVQNITVSNNSQPVFISLPVQIRYASQAETLQETAGTSDISPPIDIHYPDMATGIKSILDDYLKGLGLKKDEPVKPPVVVVPPVVEPEPEPEPVKPPVVVVPPVGNKIVAYKYAGRTNGDRPTWRLKGSLKVGTKFTFQCGPITDMGVAKPRKGGVGWDKGGEVVKNSDGYKNEMAILIDTKHKSNFKAADCSITLY